MATTLRNRQAKLSMRRVAIIHDWLYTYAGGERVLEQMLRCFPKADLFSLIDCVPDADRGFLEGRTVRTSFMQRLPFVRQLYQKYLPLMPAAIESLDLREYDLVLSSSSAIARGVLTEPHQLHICYLQSRSLRYLYDERFAYSPGGILGVAQEWLMSPIRTWDSVAARRPDRSIANSDFVRRWHRHRYGIEAAVVYPPVDVELFGRNFNAAKDDYYVVVSRLARYKLVPLVVEAFNRLGRRLLIVGAGPEETMIRRLAKSNVELVGPQRPEEVAKLVSRARALVFAGREDFGIAPVEAQAAGTCVVAFAQGGVAETVRGLDVPDSTGVLFHEQTEKAIAAAIEELEVVQGRISPNACRENALRFSPERFRREYADFVETAWSEFVARGSGAG